MSRQLMAQLGEIQRRTALQADYDKTLALLASLKAGDLCLDDVTLTDGGWQLVEPTVLALPAPTERRPFTIEGPMRRNCAPEAEAMTGTGPGVEPAGTPPAGSD